jgi:hypothetical protein
MAKTSQAQKIRVYMTANPDKSVSQVAKDLGFKYHVVYMAKRNMDKKKAEPKQGWKTVHISAFSTPLPVTMHEPKSDPVNHPAHYKVGGIETIDFIEAKRLNYNMGNAVKYITRADHKGSRKQDIEKAIWYLKRELDHSI